MYTSPVSLVLGFHGCDRSIGERVIRGDIGHLRKSENRYDWLGNGIYFWENNPERALDFARERQQRPRGSRASIQEPFVLGAVIELGNCLNLLESTSLQMVAEAYDRLAALCANSGTPLPVNAKDEETGDRLQRDLDCAVLETLQQLNESKPFDTVRGAFIEGPELYPNAGFRAKNHIQLCVRNPACIKGYFRLLPDKD